MNEEILKIINSEKGKTTLFFAFKATSYFLDKHIMGLSISRNDRLQINSNNFLDVVVDAGTAMDLKNCPRDGKFNRFAIFHSDFEKIIEESIGELLRENHNYGLHATLKHNLALKDGLGQSRWWGIVGQFEIYTTQHAPSFERFVEKAVYPIEKVYSVLFGLPSFSPIDPGSLWKVDATIKDPNPDRKELLKILKETVTKLVAFE